MYLRRTVMLERRRSIGGFHLSRNAHGDLVGYGDGMGTGYV